MTKLPLEEHIGGFFELEQPRGRPSGTPHEGGIALNTGRACLRAVLAEVRPRRVHVPFYICKVVVRQLSAAGVQVSYYGLDSGLRPTGIEDIAHDEMILVVNYFGLQRKPVGEIAASFGDRCIVDAAQAFFDAPIPGSWTLNSARKFFGVPDGAYLYVPRRLELGALATNAPDLSHLVLRRQGKLDEAFRRFRAYEDALHGEIRQMSPVARQLLAACDLNDMAARRRTNFMQLHSVLAAYNELPLDLEPGAVPMAYPFLPCEPADRESLIRDRLYVPTLWPEVMESPGERFGFERDLARRLLPLPVDHRYGPVEMEEVARRVLTAVRIH